MKTTKNQTPAAAEPTQEEVSAAVKGKKELKDAVLTLRLDVATDERLRAAAEKRGLGPSTLARMWLLEKLSEEPTPPGKEWV